MDGHLTQDEIVRIARILSEDPEAVDRKEQIYGHLGLLQAEIEDLKRRVYLDGSDSYGFFTRTLSRFHSRNGSRVTVNTLINHFTELGLTAVVEKIGRIDVSKGVWFEVEFPVESFTGREKELNELQKMMLRNAETATVINQISIVSGLGGVGKSELVRKYAFHHRDFYGGNVLWINAESEGAFRNSIFRLFEAHFNLFENEAKNETNEKLMERIYDRFSTKEKCLIIFDNVEEFDVIMMLPKYLKNATAKIPNVLITSRNTKWKHGTQVLNLDVLRIEEAIDFVQNVVENTDEGDARNLAQALQCLPLALQQAVAYIRAELSEHFVTIEKYLELFVGEQDSFLLEFRNDRLSDHEQTTLKTWTLTLKTIKSNHLGSLAIQIMNMTSYFEPDYIPGTIFANLDPNLDDVIRAIGLLKSYSMISGPPGIIHVHRLTQRVVRFNIDTIERQTILQHSLELMEAYIDARNSDMFVRALVPHAVSVWGHSLEHDELIKKFADFASNVCKNLIVYGRNSLALGVARRSKLSIERILGPKRAYTILIKFYEAWALYRIQKYPDSMEIVEEILPPAITELNSSGNWLTQTIRNLKALLLAQEQKLEERLELVEQIEQIQWNRSDLDEIDADVLRALLEKANALLALGKVKEALEVAQYVLEKRTQYYGEDHEETKITADFVFVLQIQTVHPMDGAANETEMASPPSHNQSCP